MNRPPLPDDIQRLAYRRALVLRDEVLDETAQGLRRWMVAFWQRLLRKETPCHS